ncbi:MAG: DNA polymerase III subunit epsilon [Alphaproteobacteria bacterium]|nr:DNA polymerase III subunit epsilon [Alphaproteobacteria bacterium]
MREIVLDTETTGLDPDAGHRLVEIAAIELVNHLPTGRKFQRYLKPECEMSPEAQAVHGLTLAFLADKPVFAEIVSELLEFMGDSRLVIHNAEFDLKFLNAELKVLGFPQVPGSRAIDTVQLARRKFPGAPASLDALCQRFNIDNTHRTLHGALLDAELLSEVYLELVGGRQSHLSLEREEIVPILATGSTVRVDATSRNGRVSRVDVVSEVELAAHTALLARLKNPIWTA